MDGFLLSSYGASWVAIEAGLLVMYRGGFTPHPFFKYVKEVGSTACRPPDESAHLFDRPGAEDRFRKRFETETETATHMEARQTRTIVGGSAMG